MATEVVNSRWHGLVMAAFHILGGQKPEGLRLKSEVNCLKVTPLITPFCYPDCSPEENVASSNSTNS